MELDDYINYVIKSLLKNQILEVLQEIKIMKVLKRSNFIKWDIGYLVVIGIVIVATNLMGVYVALSLVV